MGIAQTFIQWICELKMGILLLKLQNYYKIFVLIYFMNQICH